MCQGLTLLKNVLSDNSSRLTVTVCSLVAKKVRSLARDSGEALKKLTGDKENRERNAELRRIVVVLEEERGKVEEQLLGLEGEAENAKEPNDIVLLRFAEEEGLTQ